MSTPGKTIFQVQITRHSGINTKAYLEHIKKAVACYKQDMWPGDPFIDFNMDDVHVYKRFKQKPVGWLVLCGDDPDFPKYFKDEESLQTFRTEYKGERPIYVKKLITENPRL